MSKELLIAISIFVFCLVLWNVHKTHLSSDNIRERLVVVETKLRFLQKDVEKLNCQEPHP